jgi:hypothetical protein
VKEDFLNHLHSLDEETTKYLKGENVPFPISIHRSLFFSIVDFTANHITKENNPHIRSQFFACLRLVLEKHFSMCLYGSNLGDQKRVVSSFRDTVLMLTIPFTICYTLLIERSN